MSILSRLVVLFLSLPLWLAAPDSSAEVLDPAFDGDGLRVLDGALNDFIPLGSCPLANGSVAVVAFRAVGAQLAVIRLRADGALDTAFSGDGVNVLPAGAGLAPQWSSTACAGVGNGDPFDDRMMVAATAPGTYDLMVLALVDLNSGGFDANFYLGGPGYYDLGGMAFPPSNGARLYPRVHTRGVFPGANGEWLVVGQLDGNTQTGVPTGVVARINAGGAIDAVASPNLTGFASDDLVAARVGGDGDIRVFGNFRMSGGTGWGVMRVHGSTLAPVGMGATATPDGFWSRVYKGRQIGGGAMVVGGLVGDNSAFGSAARLYVIRGDAVRTVFLPAAPALGGSVAVGATGDDNSVAATGASGNRAVFAMGLRSSGQSQVGYYVASVQLGDGAGVPDSVETAFGVAGVASFTYPGTPGCSAGQFPAQYLSNIASWGLATTLVGATAPTCGQAPSQPLVARLDTDTARIFNNGFD